MRPRRADESYDQLLLAARIPRDGFTNGSHWQEHSPSIVRRHSELPEAEAAIELDDVWQGINDYPEATADSSLLEGLWQYMKD